MRLFLTIVLAMILAAAAQAAQDPTSNRFDPGIKGLGDGALGPRTGGDTVADATFIPSLPYSDSGTTCGFVHDYTDCVYNSGAPDVVYAYTAISDGTLCISLCGSGYDTALWVYAGSVGNTVGCNDDFCGLQSQIENIPLTAGVTYYIVVSGYATACGSYTLSTCTPPPPCVECPAGSQQEGEPACYDGYVDNYDGGCNSTGWVTVNGDENGEADVCGLSGTYLYNGLSYRDTDWYDVVAAHGTVTMSCIAEFDLQIVLFYGTDCGNLFYFYTTTPPCTQTSLHYAPGTGVHLWPWVGPSIFTGVPCNKEYWMHLEGLMPPGPTGACCGPDGSCTVVPAGQCAGVYQGDGTTCEPNPCGTPVRPTSWGGIKRLYRS